MTLHTTSTTHPTTGSEPHRLLDPELDPTLDPAPEPTARRGRPGPRPATGEHLVPRLHVRPPRGYLNDPNGPILVGDTVHLYFQSRPTLDVAVPVQWGHATSTDLVTWTVHRPAMTPTPDGPDRDGCYSGNTVLDQDGHVRAFYSGYVRSLPYQSVLTAVSTDGGRTFGPPTQVVADPDPQEGVVMFRDPFVWRDGDRWRMVVGSERVGEVAAVRHYESPDLRTWTFTGELASCARGSVPGLDTGAGWECPQVATVDGVDSVIVAAWAQSYLVGSVLVLDRADAGAPYVLDHGRSFYAASVMRESPYGRLVFGWLRECADADGWGDRGWAGVISLPRVLGRGRDGRLRCSPVPTMYSLRAEAARPADGAVLETSSFELELPMTSSTTRLCFGPDEEVQIHVDVEADTVILDHDRASLDPRAHRGRITVEDALVDHPQDIATVEEQEWAARVFVDGSVIEVFTASGRVLTARVYPTAPPPWRVRSAATARVWELRAPAASGRPSTGPAS